MRFIELIVLKDYGTKLYKILTEIISKLITSEASLFCRKQRISSSLVFISEWSYYTQQPRKMFGK